MRVWDMPTPMHAYTLEHSNGLGELKSKLVYYTWKSRQLEYAT